jgi:hypothetical protein
MNVLVAEKGWGPISDEKAIEIEADCRAFHCGMCSAEAGHRILHNTLGRHLHVNFISEDHPIHQWLESNAHKKN